MAINCAPCTRDGNSAPHDVTATSDGHPGSKGGRGCCGNCGFTRIVPGGEKSPRAGKKHCLLLLWRKDQCARSNPRNPLHPRKSASPMNVAASPKAFHSTGEPVRKCSDALDMLG